jgi:hypothetical protein
MIIPLRLVFLGRADSPGSEDLTVDSNNRIENRLIPFLCPEGQVEDVPSSGPYIQSTHILIIDYSSTDNQELTQLKELIATYPSSNFLICRDSSISTSNRDELWSILNYIFDNNIIDGKDLFFLGKWMDNCIAYDSAGTVGLTNLVDNSTPIGFQSVLITSDGATKINDNTNTKTTNLDLTLNEMIAGGLKTLACTPNFFSYDTTYISTDSIIAAKTQECGNPISDFKPARDEDLAFFWFLIICIISGILAWIIYRLAGAVDYRFSPNVIKMPMFVSSDGITV